MITVRVSPRTVWNLSVRGQAIYELGNMTLINSKLNSSISNGAFVDKIEGKNGNSGLNIYA